MMSCSLCLLSNCSNCLFCRCYSQMKAQLSFHRSSGLAIDSQSGGRRLKAAQDHSPHGVWCVSLECNICYRLVAAFFLARVEFEFKHQ